jgi:hypothetical protein
MSPWFLVFTDNKILVLQARQKVNRKGIAPTTKKQGIAAIQQYPVVCKPCL